MTIHDFPVLRTRCRAGYRELGDAISEQMKGFGALHRSAVADSGLSKATKELMAVAIWICTHCDGCIALDAHDALRVGATRQQLYETIGVALLMDGGPASTYAPSARAVRERRS
jgi:AhpD family alkylhydroperoxidase